MYVAGLTSEACGALARLRSDCSQDSNFAATITGRQVMAITPLFDDRVLIGGDFTEVDGVARPGLARLKRDGSVDLTFRPPDFLGTAPTLAVAVQAEDKVVVASQGYTLADESSYVVLRLNTDGSLDATFHPVAAPLTSFVVTPERGFVVLMDYGLAHYRYDGSSDTTFVADVPPDASFGAALVLPDGKIVLDGKGPDGFDHVLLRLNPDGSRDASFAVDTVLDGPVDSFVLQANGKVYLTEYAARSWPGSRWTARSIRISCRRSMRTQRPIMRLSSTPSGCSPGVNWSSQATSNSSTD